MVALRGDKFDGHEFLAEAFARGAAGAVVQCSVDPLTISDDSFVVRVPDTRAALSQLAAANRQRSRAKVVGITGSCGKTNVLLKLQAQL